VVAQEPEQRRGEQDGDRGPEQLAAALAGEDRVVQPVGRLRPAQVQPAKEAHAQPVDQGNRRQDHRVGVGRAQPHDHVHGQEDDGQDACRHPEVAGDGVEQVRLDGGQVARHHDHAEQQQDQLGAASPA
jgi:hypothetical protein